MERLDAPGVSPRVIRKLQRWIDESGNSEQEEGYWLEFDAQISRRDAVYIVDCLREFLPQLNSGTLLLLGEDEISDQAIDVFCGFLNEDLLLPGLCLWNLPRTQFRRLLEALHPNTSVRYLCIGLVDGNEGGLSIADLLTHKSNLTHVRLAGCHFPISLILPDLRRGHLHLGKLQISSCAMDDEGTSALVDALVEGDFCALHELDLSCNCITSMGLHSLVRLTPATVLPSLQNLKIIHNGRLFQDLETTQLFAQKLLLSKDSTIITEFDITGCGKHSSEIIKACESADQLRELRISPYGSMPFIHQQTIVNQLIQSLPKMKSVQRLISRSTLFSMDNQPLMTALYKNTSITQVATNDETGPYINPILIRNRRLAQVDGLLRPTTTTAVSGGSSARNNNMIPNSLWSWVLANVGEGSQGATPVFKILCDRLATWAEETNSKKSDEDDKGNKKRKREEDNKTLN